MPRADHLLGRVRIGPTRTPAPSRGHRSADVTSLPHALETVIPVAFATAEAAQATNGGSNPRFGPVFTEPAAAQLQADNIRTVASSRTTIAWGTDIGDALTARGIKSVSVACRTLGAEVRSAAEQLGQAARDSGPIDAVVVALVGGGGGANAGDPMAAGSRRARRDCRERPHRRRLGPCGVGLFGGERAAGPAS